MSKEPGQTTYSAEQTGESERTSAPESAPPMLNSLEVIGKYRIIQRLGKGGMGEVYMAEQAEPIRRQVALKIIKWGMDTKDVVARFETERQALAMMSHPNIAKVFDAGATSQGRPFFVMECIKGVPITDYCNMNRLPIEERLQLFLQVCDGIQHAHQKGIIHRDIKASNILVTVQDGRPVSKIIDFGVAKATEQRLTERTVYTELGQLIGTPEYMSPEQAEMTGLDVDTRTDVYSLGVLLYELIVGVLPFDPKTLRSGGLDTIRRRIREEEPPKPSSRLALPGFDTMGATQNRKTDISTLAKQLSGELDWITIKAMAKDRTRRFATASELAADINRYLRHEPVLSSPPSVSYRMSKFIRRHRFVVITGILVVLALIGGASGVTVGYFRAKEAEQVARNEADKAKAINAFLQEILGSANPMAGSSHDVTVLEALKAATDKINSAFEEQPEVAAEVKTTIGVTYLHLGRYEEAESLLQSALTMWSDLRGPEHPAITEALGALAVLRHERGDYDEAEQLTRRALAIKRKELKSDEHEDITNILNNLGVLLQDKGDLVGAETIFRRVLKIDRKMYGDDHLYVGMDLSGLAGLLRDKGDYAKSEEVAAQAIAILRKHNHPGLAITLGGLGATVIAKGDTQAAEPILAEALQVGLRHFGEKNQDVAKIRSRYGLCLVQLKRFDEAERQLQAALPILRDSLGQDNEVTQKALNHLVTLYTAWGKPEKAAQYRSTIPANGN